MAVEVKEPDGKVRGCSLQRGKGVPGGLSASPSEDGRSLGTRTRTPRGSAGARWWFLGGGWGAFRPAAASPRFLYPPPPKIKRGKKGPKRAGIPLRLRVQQPAGPPERSSTARGRRFPPAVSAPWRPLWAAAGSVGGSVLPGCREDGGGVFVGAGFGADGAGRAAAAGLPGGPGTVPFPRELHGSARAPPEAAAVWLCPTSAPSTWTPWCSCRRSPSSALPSSTSAFLCRDTSATPGTPPKWPPRHFRRCTTPTSATTALPQGNTENMHSSAHTFTAD
ncbi:collagen alpha-2(I) chain-like [Heliangelus exortis]|uniref:collagen alpha-2(I) chain-like n=1 Tax=Heliangelus exortis TaxID=472823 RepID=UPI003A8ED86E